MASIVAKQLNEELRGAVNYLGVIDETGRRIDESCQLDDAQATVGFVLAGCAGMGKEVERADAGRRR